MHKNMHYPFSKIVKKKAVNKREKRETELSGKEGKERNSISR